MEQKKHPDVLNPSFIWEKIKEYRKNYLLVIAITFLCSGFLILCVPRYYTALVRMAPEMAGADGGGTLGTLASSFGINLGDMQTTDAISPLLYPDVIESNDFLVGLSQIQVTTSDQSIQCSYFDYMSKHYKEPFWTVAKNQTLRFFINLVPKKAEIVQSKGSQINPFWMSKYQAIILGRMSQHIACGVDKKTGVISISVKAQDPLVCAQMADSVQAHLQDYIIKYRTSKARIDVDYYQELVDQAKVDYEASVERYSDYCDRHQNVILQSYISERDKLENDMQTRYGAYSTMITHIEAAKAKLQERTPAFTLLQSPTVPVMPAGPKRMFFVVFMVVLAIVITTGIILKEDIKQAIEELK